MNFKSTKKNKSIVLHFIICIAFLLQPIILPSKMNGLENAVGKYDMTKDVLANLLMIVFFYVNYLYLIPKLYFNKKYFIYGLSVISGFIIILSLPAFIAGKVLFAEHGFDRMPPPGFAHNPPHPPPYRGDRNFYFHIQDFFSNNDHIFFLFIVIASFTFLLRVRSRWFHTEKARQEAEIAYLMSQVNPHFLFNALNSIYVLTIKEKADKSAESMLKLAAIMRYIVTKSGSDTVYLKEEIAYITDYVELQKLRITPNVKFSFSVSGNLQEEQITPLLLVPFVENAFKYGINPDEDSEIEIAVQTGADFVRLDVKNKKVVSPTSLSEQSGIGIENTKKRLELLYPSMHELVIEDSENTFTVQLIIYFR